MIDFVKIIDKKVMEDKPVDNNFDDKRFHPSSAGYCERQIFLNKAGLKHFNRYVKGAMFAGTIIHQWLQSHVKDQSKVEVAIKTELNSKKYNPCGVYFEGYADFIHKNIPYDFKTTANIKYNADGIKDYHKDQLLVYMAGIKAKNGAIVYIDKRDLSPKQFTVAVDNKRINDLFAKINKVYKAYKDWVSNKITEMPFEKCGCYFCKSEKLKSITEICLCKGQANLVYFDHNTPILKCEKCGDKFEAAEN